MRAYSDLYVLEAQRTLGSMLDFAVNGCRFDLAAFYDRFLASGLAQRFGLGEPCLIAGRSGVELALDVIQATDETGFQRDRSRYRELERSFAPIGGASPEFWTGWALAYYQWESGQDFGRIQQLVPIGTVRDLYHPFHEMDVTQFCDQMDCLCVEVRAESALKAQRLAAGLSQSQLARAAGISVRTLQQYEQRRKDINKAQVECVVRLARALHCSVEDLLEYSSQPHHAFEYAVVEL
ncbi:MAG: helix-turn-helix transcriptional regulator [Coriobacteriia bacterium]|nr:helix-turn-helix transcriptional regulator [Coriobacteriia bacterium]